MKESLYFVYDGINSQDMGVVQISTSGGLFQEEFLAPKTLITEKVRGREKPYFFGVEREPLTIPLELWFENGITEDGIREVARWIDQDLFKELYFSNNPNRRFYAQYEGSSSFLHNGIKQGYVQIQMKCDSPYSYSPVYTSDVYDLSVNPTSKEITFTNYGDVNLRPIMYIEKIGQGNISIVNKSNAGEEFALTNLTNQELITIDNEYEEIESDIPGILRYDDHNSVFLELVRGVNYLQVTGACKLQFKYQFITKQG